MAYSYVDYIGDGVTTVYPLTFGYVKAADVTALVAGANTTFTFPTATTIQFATPPANLATIRLRRQTNRVSREVTFTDGSTATAAVANKDSNQNFYLAQELLDSYNLVVPTTANFLFGADALKPAAGTANRMYVATDTFLIYLDSGAAWQTLSPAFTGDVTKPANSTVQTIANAAVTTPKLAATVISAATAVITPATTDKVLVDQGGVLKSETLAQLIGLVPSSASLRDLQRNLRMDYASTSTATLTADEIIVADGTPTFTRLAAVSLTLNIATSGANGLDTGAEAASTWYYAWVIYNPTTLTTAGLLSISSTAPTMPSGYTAKSLVGAIRNDASSNFIRFVQRGKSVACALTAVYNGSAGALAYATQSLSAFIPPTASVASGVIGRSSTTGATTPDGIVVAADVNGVGAVIVNCGYGGSTIDGYYSAGQFRVTLITAQQVSHKMSATTAVYAMSISGWEYP